VFHSPDRGVTFEPGVRAVKGENLLNPAFVITEAGTLALTYTAEANGRALFKIARSSDDGKSFTCSVIKDVGPFPQDVFAFGYDAGLAVGGGRLFAVFADGTSMVQNNNQVGFLRLDMP
jgi:hypothetical protein